MKPTRANMYMKTTLLRCTLDTNSARVPLSYSIQGDMHISAPKPS